MQSHASRHGVSEHLVDRHPYQGQPFEKVARPDEIAVAYGDRQIPKLVGVLGLPADQLPETERIRCLQLFRGLLSTQETQIAAVQAGAMAPLLSWLGNDGSSAAMQRLCCSSIGSICQLRQGRDAFVAAGGVAVLTSALLTTPDEAMAAFKVLCSCVDGAAALLASPCRVLGSLLEGTERPGTSYPAAGDAAACVKGLCGSDEGVTDALACQAPRLLGELAARALRHTWALGSGGDGGDKELVLCLLREVAAAMAVIAYHPDGKTQLRLAGNVQVLAQMLAVRDATVEASAASCLAAMTIEVDSKLPVMQAAGEALVALVRRGQGDVVPAALAARTALLSAAEQLDARRKLELLVPGTAQREALLGGPLSQVPPDYKYVVWKSEE